MFIKFHNTYARLPENFYTRFYPVPVATPKLIIFNTQLASELGIDVKNFNQKELTEVFSGNKILKGSKPIALVYAGHQFGYFVPQLGDGRAILLGEVVDREGQRRDIQLKGSGRTPYARHADGRAVLGPMIREYIISEAMYALGVKTTRSLALITTGEYVLRDTMLPGAVLTRVALSHVRIGTFEYFAAQRDGKSIKILADYVIYRNYPNLKDSNNPYLSLLEHVMDAQVSLVIDWIRVGFIHGVMNTDNMVVSGETIDYGPCAFLDEYYANKVFSSIDSHGRYAFNNQADICFWNLLQFGKSIAFLINPDPHKALEVVFELIEHFKSVYNKKYLKTMGQKIGLVNPEEKDKYLIEELLEIMQEASLDYTLTFRYLCYAVKNAMWPYYDIFIPPGQLEGWIKKWRIRLKAQGFLLEKIADLMFSHNPAVIPRNHKIEEVIKAAQGKNNDFSQMYNMLNILSAPYKENGDITEYMKPPTLQERINKTFCGT